MPENKGNRPKNYDTYTDDDCALIMDMADQGKGYKAIYTKYVTMRSAGKKPWTLYGVKRVIQRMKKPKREKK